MGHILALFPNFLLVSGLIGKLPCLFLQYLTADLGASCNFILYLIGIFGKGFLEIFAFA